MSILVYTESWEGKFRKSTFEAVSYARKIADLSDINLLAISFGKVDNEELKKIGKYGAKKVISFESIHKGDSEATTNAISQFIEDISLIIFSDTYTSKMIAPRLSAKHKIGAISNVIDLPQNIQPITVKRKSFSSKAIEITTLKTEKGILSIAPNSIGITEITNNDFLIEKGNYNYQGNVKIGNKEKSNGKISISEAEIVVSGGRGLKSPENFQMIEELAETLGAATACSKPVSDIGWRPHSEHVGQTGKTVNANLYIAIGISGAIQHLAGVSSSKIMVAINIDPEAPFFKAADYGIVGDAFEVVPKLIQEFQKIK